MCHTHNKHLATLASQIDVSNEIVDVKIMKRTYSPQPIYPYNIVDRLGSIHLNQLSIVIVIKNLKDIIMINNEFHHRCSEGALAQALSVDEAKEALDQVHESSCGKDDVNLYQRSQRQEYYWLEIAKDDSEV